MVGSGAADSEIQRVDYVIDAELGRVEGLCHGEADGILICLGGMRVTKC